MSAFFAMVKKELRSVVRERTIMIAIVIQLFVASFSSVIVIGLIAYYDPDTIGQRASATVRVGIILDTGSPLVGLLGKSRIRVTTFYDSLDAERAFQRGGIDTIIYLPEDKGGAVEMKLILPESETRSTVILMVLREPLKQYESLLRERGGVHVRYSDIRGTPATTYEFLYSSIIPILMFFPAFIAGSMVVDSISEEFENHTLDTIWSAPVSLNSVFGAKIVAALVLAMTQSTLWAMLLRLNHIYMHNLGLVLLLSVVVATFSAVACAFIATYLKDRERSQFTYSLFLLIAVGGGYLVGASPIALMTRLATGDYYTGARDIILYALAPLALVTVFPLVSRKLMAIKR